MVGDHIRYEFVGVVVSVSWLGEIVGVVVFKGCLSVVGVNPGTDTTGLDNAVAIRVGVVGVVVV